MYHSCTWEAMSNCVDLTFIICVRFHSKKHLLEIVPLTGEMSKFWVLTGKVYDLHRPLCMYSRKCSSGLRNSHWNIKQLSFYGLQRKKLRDKEPKQPFFSFANGEKIPFQGTLKRTECVRHSVLVVQQVLSNCWYCSCFLAVNTCLWEVSWDKANRHLQELYCFLFIFFNFWWTSLRSQSRTICFSNSKVSPGWCS